MAEHAAEAIFRKVTLPRRPEDSNENDGEDSEAIRQSLEALDQVLDQFDAGTVKAKNGLNASKVVLRPKDSVREAVYQSLSFLDGVLAEFETEETAITKEQENESLPIPEHNLTQPKHLDVGEPAKKIAFVKKSPSPSPPGSPLSSQKLSSPGAFFGPPVPKRSPTTCLSTSSVGGEGPLTPDTPIILLENPFPPSAGENFEERKREEESCESSGSLLSGEESGGEKLGSGGRSRKLSSRPVQKGSSRPKLRPHHRKLATDEKSDDKSSDDVFLSDDQSKALPKTTAMTDIHSAAQFNHIDKFALIKHLLLTGELPGLDELPPSFKPPPPPSKTTNNNKNNTNCIKGCDPNGNVGQAVHVTSVKITPDVANHPPTLPPAPPNISVIKIQAKNKTTNQPASAINKNTCQQRTDVPQSRKKAFAKNSSHSPPAPPSKKPETSQTSSSQLNNNNNNTNSVEPRIKLSTFNRDLPSPVSSSQEDLCKSNSGSLERKPLEQPEVRNISGPVFFNVFQSDGTPPPDGSVVPEAESKKETEVGKKKGWMMRKSKKANNQQATKAKDEIKEVPPSENNDSQLGPPVAVAEKALLAELSGRLRRAPSPPRDKPPAVAPPLATLDDSDEDASEQSCSQQGPRPNKEERSKWKIWRKKEGKADQ